MAELGSVWWGWGRAWGHVRAYWPCASVFLLTLKIVLVVERVSKDSRMGAWHRRAVQGEKGLWDTGGARGLGQALENKGLLRGGSDWTAEGRWRQGAESPRYRWLLR